MAKKLIIEVDNGEGERGTVIRVSDKANALLEDVAQRSKRSKAYVASRMIEFAYEFVKIEGADEDV